MVSKRQKLAKKKFKEANPELFPVPEPAAPKDPNKKKKLKAKKSGPHDPNKPKKSSFKKHPLRVAGMKPGESCFICRAPDHIAKLCPMKSEWERNKICLSCRQRGHSLKNCPNNENDNSTDKKFCYNCGDMGHSLARCPQPLQDGGTKYANCFICNETGHLSKDCPKNTHGIYPKGGSCKICGGITHLARDCPNKRIGAGGVVRQSFDASYERPNRITKLVSGDDLDDDFASLVPNEEKEDNVKTKKKQGPKVIDYLYFMRMQGLVSRHGEYEPKKGLVLCHHPIKKPKMANAVSGMSVHDECKLKFLDLKAKRNYRFIIFKIDGQQVVVDKLGEPTQSYEDFAASLPSDECRYAVFDFDFITNENCQKSKIFFIAWSPETSKVRNKMVYASTKDRFRRELDGVQVELQATDPSEMSFDIIKARAH